jgi:fluoroacetyl-CoA thioesterase
MEQGLTMYSPELKIGYAFESTFDVEDSMTVPNMYTTVPFARDMPDVLATGYMVGIMELACTGAVMKFVDWPRVQSVGTLVNFTHLAATPAGMRLTIKGEVIELEGRRIRFAVQAWDEHDKICEGIHERFFIDPAKFNTKLTEKQNKVRVDGA